MCMLTYRGQHIHTDFHIIKNFSSDNESDYTGWRELMQLESDETASFHH